MIRLQSVKIKKYKSIEEEQAIEFNDRIGVLVGMNESGKTALLESLAKTNYFTDDNDFKFNTTGDYPRKDLKKLQKSGENPIVVTATYELGDTLIEELKKLSLEPKSRNIKINTKYDNNITIGNLIIDKDKFVKAKLKQFDIKDKNIENSIIECKDRQDLDAILSQASEDEVDISDLIDDLKQYFENDSNWENPLESYVYINYIKPNLPKYLYYDEYYALPSRINLNQLDSLEGDEIKTARALFELANIDINQLINSENFEDFRAELEATANEISQMLFKYWNTNQNLRIRFEIDKRKNQNNQLEHILDIRVENLKHMVTLPLANRSKGFNWFFSFLVWFSKIQENQDSNYIILLDEPGLNLHASAQSDLLNFIEEELTDYQVIYSTHSPFMVEPKNLHRVKTVYDGENGTRVLDSIKEKDPKTLFPLQAALGYDIAQNLFISPKNLLVEGPSELLYFTVINEILRSEDRPYLDEDITIVPVGGLDKVVTFVSLLRGSELGIASILDTPSDKSSKSKLEDLVKAKIIKNNNIRYFDEFSRHSGSKSDVEDMFEKSEYLKIFNKAFEGELKKLKVGDLNSKIKPIIIQINEALNIKGFNHYRPANKLMNMGVEGKFFNDKTKERFSNMFEEINKLF
jgi:predicted ATP-dependent endonuclease of OLD family